MNEIAVDYGRKRTGLAALISGVVVPLDPIRDTTWEKLSSRLQRLHEENGKGEVILGLPLSAGGKHTQLSREVQQLAAFLEERGFIVKTVSETRSTLESEDHGTASGARDGRKDSLAAMVILKRFLGLP